MNAETKVKFTELITRKRDELVMRLVEEAERKVKGRRRNIYVASYSKEFTKEAEKALVERGISAKAYHSETDDETKKEDVNSSWKNYQVVLVTSTIGPGSNFYQKHFDVAFSVIGRGSGTVEEQFQLLHRVRHLSENKVFLCIEKEGCGEGSVPTPKQIAEDLLEKYKRGKEESPEMKTMPLPLRQHFITSKQKEIRSSERFEEELDRVLKLHNYEIDEVEVVEYKNCPDYRIKAPNIKDIKDISPEELKVKIRSYTATAEDKKAGVKNPFKKIVQAEGEIENSLWEIFHDQPTKRQFFKYAFFEKAGFTAAELQIIDCSYTWAELSQEYRPRFQTMQRLNKALGLENSFAGREKEIPRVEFLSLVLPILRDKDVQSLFEFKIKEEEKLDAKKAVNLVNKIYQNWTGKEKVFNGKQRRKRVKGKVVSTTPLILRETTIGNNDKEFVLWNFIRGEKGEGNIKEVEEMFAFANREEQFS